MIYKHFEWRKTQDQSIFISGFEKEEMLLLHWNF